MTKAERLLEAIECDRETETGCTVVQDTPQPVDPVGTKLPKEIASLRDRGIELGHIIETIGACYSEVNNAYERMSGLFKHLEGMAGNGSDLASMIESLKHSLSSLSNAIMNAHKLIQQATEERNEK